MVLTHGFPSLYVAGLLYALLTGLKGSSGAHVHKFLLKRLPRLADSQDLMKSYLTPEEMNDWDPFAPPSVNINRDALWMQYADFAIFGLDSVYGMFLSQVSHTSNTLFR